MLFWWTTPILQIGRVLTADRCLLDHDKGQHLGFNQMLTMSKSISPRSLESIKQFSHLWEAFCRTKPRLSSCWGISTIKACENAHRKIGRRLIIVSTPRSSSAKLGYNILTTSLNLDPWGPKVRIIDRRFRLATTRPVYPYWLLAVSSPSTLQTKTVFPFHGKPLKRINAVSLSCHVNHKILVTKLKLC